MSNRKMRVGDQMMDLLTGEKKVIQSLSPEVTFEDGSKMKNPLCYKFIRNDNPFPVPKEITINDHTMVIDEVNVDCGHFRPLKVLHKYEGGLVLEALAKDQKHRILLSYAISTDRFFVISEHAADSFDIIYDDGRIWIVRSERTDEVTEEEPDENGDPVIHHPVFENLLIFNDYRIIETLSSDWMFGKAVLIQKDGDNKTATLVFVSDKKRDEHGEPQDTDGKSRITRVTVSAPLEPEDENNPEEYGVETRTDVFLGGTARKISLVPHGVFAPGLFVIGWSSILYSGEQKRWADGADVAKTAMAYPHLIRCDVDGDTTTFVLANDQYETVRIRTEATSDRGLVSTIEEK